MRKLAKIIVLTALAAVALFVESVESRAQGMYFSSIALSVTSLPGTPQGLSNVVVPIPNASVYVCTGTYLGTACSASVGTKATLWSCAALSGCAVTQPVVGDFYGNFGFWAAPGSYYYTQTGQVNGLVTSASYQITLPLACGTSCAAAIFNATTGFQVGGAAPLNYLLLGNGTVFVPVASIPASLITGLPGSNYQTVQSQSTALPQEANLNFGYGFVLADVAGNHQTTVNFNFTGSGTYVPSVLTAPGSSVAPAVWDGSGNLEPEPGWSTTTVDDYFKTTGCAINNSGNLNSCLGTVTFTSGGNTTPSFAAMPDTNYEIFCTVDTGTQSSASFSVTGSTNSGNTPAFTRTTTGFNYVWTEIMSNSAAGSAAPVFDCHLHHN